MKKRIKKLLSVILNFGKALDYYKSRYPKQTAKIMKLGISSRIENASKTRKILNFLMVSLVSNFK